MFVPAVRGPAKWPARAVYSLIETATLRGEDPGDYLLRAALAAIEQPGTVTLPNSFD